MYYTTPLPPCHRRSLSWFIHTVYFGRSVLVRSEGMVCSVTILLVVHLLLWISLGCCRWRVGKGFGLLMFLFFSGFVAVSLGFEYRLIVCPV